MEKREVLKRRRGALTWILQAGSGSLLVVVLILHMVANHFAAGELLRYEDVIAYLSNPVVFTLETLLLISVTFHALAGVRAVILDLGLTEKQIRRLTRGLWILGILMVAYGIGLTLYITA